MRKATEGKGDGEQQALLEKQKAALEKLAEERLKHVLEHMEDLESCDDLNMR